MISILALFVFGWFFFKSVGLAFRTYVNGIADSLKADAKSYVDEARAIVAAAKSSKQKPTASAGDGASASSSD